jgi:2-polyprenyl-3-methyl-5-hydroxy-6-metoxy-1,4-benzoquinol methylase
LNRPNCHLCGVGELSRSPSYPALHRVTSDCKPWPAGGELGVCLRCGAAQAIISSQWEAEARAIYEAYSIYHQSGGTEQSVFDPITGAAASRSSRLLGRLKREVSFPEKGRLLDIGCGNGATLRAFGEIAPCWSLVGLEVNDHYKKTVESIPGVEALYTGTIAAIPGEFHAISLIHALEHIAHPGIFLNELSGKLAVGGMLVVQVPDCGQNPFMFVVADHATHFFKSTLCELVAANGYEVVVAADNWIAKELTIVARRTDRPSPPAAQVNAAENSKEVAERVAWLRAFGDEVRALAAKKPIGIFGTSIAATWLHQELGGATTFFVDEDPNRVGEMFMGRRILPPSEVPAGSQIVLALPPHMADQVCVRLDQRLPDVRWYVPSPSVLMPVSSTRSP